MDKDGAPGGTVLTVGELAGLIDTVVAADLRLADEMDRIEGSRRPVSDATVRRLDDLLRTTLRPAVAAHAVLVEVALDQPAIFRAAIALRQQRTRAGGEAR